MKRRTRIVKYMKLMASGCRWQVKNKIVYNNSDGTVIEILPGEWYRGIPYTRGKVKRRFYYTKFLRQLRWGYLFTHHELLGVDCSSAVSYSWRKCCRYFPVSSTKMIFLDLVTDQKYISNKGRYTISADSSGTKEIITENGTDTLVKAYQALQPGDGLLFYDSAQRKGHIMLVSSSVEDGFVEIIDQKGFDVENPERKTTSWRNDFRYSYAQLIEEDFIPIYLKFC